MTRDEIESALQASHELPREALTAGVGLANELAPCILDRAKRFCSGVYLLPADLRVLTYGLHILAAARHPSLLSCLLEIFRQPGKDLDRLFPLRVPTGLARLLLSVWNRPPELLFDMIDDGDIDEASRSALFSVLARLTFDGRIARDVTVEFLAGIERDDLYDEDDFIWWSWEDAVCHLGITELEAALQRVWAKGAFDAIPQQDRDESLDELRHAAANPTDPGEFDADDIRPITDPAEAFDWIARREAALAEWDGDDDAFEAVPDTDPAASVRLSDDELGWISGFLNSRQVPALAMSMEQLDGFMTALVIGPDLVMPSEYMPLIWNTIENGEPNFDDTAQAEYVTGLLMRHWNAIAARRATHAEHYPILEPFSDGEDWGSGFLLGVDMRAEAWTPIFRDRRADQIVLPILALSGEAPEEVYEELDGDVRENIIDQLPVMLQMIAAYWQHPGGRLMPGEPLRSTKVGRNQACPCGSGKKYKKCCGDPSRLH